MTWAKVDDKLHAHPKAELAGLEAMGLWAVALSYSAAYLTDGYVTRDRVFRLAGERGPEIAGRLVLAGLWEVSAGGWTFHDWADYQPTKAEVEAAQAKKSSAGKAGAMARAQASAPSRAASPDEAPVGTGEPSSGQLRAGDPVPSRPVPIPFPDPVPSPTRPGDLSGKVDLPPALSG